MPDIVPVSTLGAIETSNLPTRHKSNIREWYDRTMAKVDGAKAPVMSVAQETSAVVRADLTAALTGAALALAEEKLGGLDLGKRKDIPVDGLVAAAGGLGAIFFAGQQNGSFASEVARNVSAAAAAVTAYRKTGQHLANGKQPPVAPAIHGEGDDSKEDPLLKYARELEV